MASDDRQLGESLLRLEADPFSPGPDRLNQTQQILDRDRRRVRWWSVLAVVAWLPAVLCTLGVLVYLGLLFPLQAKLTDIRQQQKAGTAPAGNIYVDEGRKLNLPELERDADIGFRMMSVVTGMSVLALSAATLFSLFLISASRRATLRHVNANLMQIAEELRRLRPQTGS